MKVHLSNGREFDVRPLGFSEEEAAILRVIRKANEVVERDIVKGYEAMAEGIKAIVLRSDPKEDAAGLLKGLNVTDFRVLGAALFGKRSAPGN